jgi:hypothetical protein
MTAKPLCLPVFVALAALATPVEHASAATQDFKFVSALACIPFTPNTQAGELQITTAGIYNPGTSTERVLCPMPRDQDDPYLQNDTDVTVYYRGLGAPGRVTCTLYVGSVYMQPTAIYTNTVVGNSVGNGGRDHLVIVGATQDQNYLTSPTVVLCSLEPKMAIAGLFFFEGGPTNTP